MNKHLRRFLRLAVYVAIPCLCLLSPSCLSMIVLFPSQQYRQTPAELHLPFEDVRFDNAFGRTLHGWYLPREDSKGSVAVFSGNVDNMGDFLDYARVLHEQGFSVLLTDYQGFGTSEGSPTVLSLESDGLAACDYLLGRQPPGGKIAVMGVSLGTTVALAAAARHEGVAGVIVEGAFVPREELRERMGRFGLPIAALMQYAIPRGLDTARQVRRLGDKPILFIHGALDRRTEVSGAAGLFEAAGANRWMWIIPGRGHFPQTIAADEKAYAKMVAGFLDSIFTDKPFAQPRVQWQATDAKVRVRLMMPDESASGRPARVTLCTDAGLEVREVPLTGTETAVELNAAGRVYSVSAVCVP